MYVCVCKAVTDTQIKRAISEGVCSRRELFKCLGVGGDCGKCNPHVKELLSTQEQSCNQYLMQNQPNHSILAA
jgi:bacterioferritin-associated ferredoxin